MLKILAPALAALLLGACTSPGTLITSFDTMTSDTVTDKGSYIDQNRVFSLSGSLPQAAPTQFMQYSGKRGVSTGFGVSLGESYIQVKEIPAPADISAEVSKVRDAILAARLKALAVVQAQLALASERARQALPDVDANATLLTTLKGEVTSTKTTLDTAITTANKSIEQSGLLVVRWSTKSEKSSRLAALVNVAKNKSSETSGYLIMAGVREATLFVGKDIHQAEPPLRDDMHIDWGWHPCWNFIPWFWEWEHDAYTRITTRTMMTRELAYLQDSESSAALQAQINASYSDLKDLGNALSELDKIEIEVSLAKASSLSNQGRLADAKWRIIKTPFGPLDGSSALDTAGDRGEKSGTIKGLAAFRYSDDEEVTPPPTDPDHVCDASCKHEALDLDGWMTVFAVDANFWELRNFFTN